MATANELEFDTWEIINDGGFVYKRKKRHLDPSAVARPADPARDPELEARHWRQRKRSALLKVRHRFAEEISLWKHMANALRAMEQSGTDKQVGDVKKTLGQDRIHPREGGSEPNLQFDLDELLLQVEGQEALIHHITNLCGAAEALCDAHEENVTQLLLDLPVWESPLELMASFSEDCCTEPTHDVC